MQCRICLGDDSPETLLRPCNCSGTIAYVHTSCLETYCLYVPDGMCRVCRTQLRLPLRMQASPAFWSLVGSLYASLLFMPETMVIRGVYAAAITCVAGLYHQMRVPPSTSRICSVLLLWGCLASIDTPAGLMTFLAILGLILTVYTLCIRLSPMLVLIALIHIVVTVYVGVLTLVVLASCSPTAFAVYLTLVYLLWDLWVQTPRLART